MSGNHEETKYLRFGVPPQHSRNAVTGKPLAGVSCYEGWLEEEDAVWRATFFLDTSNLSWNGIGTLVALCAMDRPACFVEGSEVGVGPDGEPLVEIERWRHVPKTTDVTSSEEHAESALDLWSRGPRDGSGAKLAQWRLGFRKAGYLPPSMAPISLPPGQRIAYVAPKGVPRPRRR